MKLICIFFSFALSASALAQLPGAMVTDHTGRTYKTVKLGTQTWMAENLRITRFQNGDSIPQARTAEEWKKADLAEQPAWCYYNNDTANDRTYGKLYNWWAITDPRKLAPAKWHIPNDEEWTRVTLFLGGERIAAQKMKLTTLWPEKGVGTNKSNFSALPSGSRDANGLFRSLGTFGIWWTAEEFSMDKSWGREMGSGNGIGRYSYQKGNGFAIRCVKD